ncbi:MAG: threonine/serine dehydratase [Sulfitobacter sp.]|nr:threonine/serine dehydratase [Sulfitobacter sp.]
MQARTNELCLQVRHTPTIGLDTPLLAKALGAGHVALKLECFQHTGTFKARGALSNVAAIPADKSAAGITAASAGNHAIAAAWAARAARLSAKVVMQDTANPFRVARARAEGAEVILRAPGAATFGEAERLSRDEGRTFIHPFDGENTMLGTAGVGLEFIEDAPDLDAVIISVGGGGLISGAAAALKLSKPGIEVFGVEPMGADSMTRSLLAGEPVNIGQPDTIADSLAPPMALPMGHAMCHAYVDDMVRVTDDAICAGMVVFQQEAKLAVEPAAGAAIAGMLGPLRERLQGKSVGIVVCGANIDAETFLQQMGRGLTHLEELTDF